MVASISPNGEELKYNLAKCRTKEIVHGKIDQCLVENPTCNYFFHFGTAIFCKHPARNQFDQNSTEEPKPSMFAKLDLNLKNL